MASFTTDIGSYALQGQGTAIVWASDTIKVRLVASSVTPAKGDTSMTGYTAIGTDQTAGTKVITNDTTDHRIVYSFAQPTWSAVAGGSTVRYMVVYKFVTNDAGSTPIFVGQLGSDLSTNGSDIVCTSSNSTTTGVGYTQQ